MVTDKSLDVGNDIDSRCLKCKSVTNHTIMALAGGKVARVQCNVCDAIHNYRAPKDSKEVESKRKTAGKAAAGARKQSVKEQKAAAAFETMAGGRNLNDAKPYAMTAVFQEHDMINHPVFGLGVVTTATFPNKIDVVFQDCSRTLICVIQRPSPLRR